MSLEFLRKLSQAYKKYAREKQEQIGAVKRVVEPLEVLLKMDKKLLTLQRARADLAGNPFRGFIFGLENYGISMTTIKIEQIKEEIRQRVSGMEGYQDAISFLLARGRNIFGQDYKEVIQQILAGEYKLISPVCKRRSLDYLSQKYFTKK